MQEQRMSENSGQNGHRSQARAAMDSTSNGTAVITGASSGIGAVYADRLAHRGYDLILVARHRERLSALAARLAEATGRSVQVLVADLNDSLDLAGVEQVLRTDPTITMLVNNAGIGSTASLLDADVEAMARMIDLNVTALVRLTAEIVPAFVERGGGTIVNIGSAVAIWPELLNGVYGGTKAFVLAFSRSLHRELAERGVRVQAVLPGATDTGLWSVAGASLDQFPEGSVMSTDDLVDAALAGLDQGELVTIPSLPDRAEWEAYEAARQQMLPKLSLSAPADRYGVQRPATLPR
jgi:short-subunit dehydrogenase